MKDTPPVPDYAALATQQGAANEAAARTAAQMNHPNQITPYGNRNWTVDPNDPNQWTVTDTLSEAEQQKLEQQNALYSTLLSYGTEYGLPALAKSLGTNFTPPREAQLGWENDYAPDQRYQTESGIWEAPWIQESLDFSGAPEIPTADLETRKHIEDSLYGSATRWLDPQFAGQQNQLDTKLSNQGIFTGSDAHAAAQAELDKARTMAYGDARDRAIAQGGQEMTNQFGMGMQAHQTGVGDITQQGTFANQSRGQLIQELLADMQARNAAIGGQTNMATSQQGASNTGTQAWLAQKSQSATLPINVMSALMNGGQVNNPQWQPFSANSQFEAAPIFNAGVAQYNANLNNTNAQNAQTGQWLNLAGGLGSAALMGGFKPWGGKP